MKAKFKKINTIAIMKSRIVFLKNLKIFYVSNFRQNIKKNNKQNIYNK